MTAMTPTRGERNHNPCNLRYVAAIQWNGLARPPQDEAGYCRFLSPAAGLRAGARDLHSKWLRGLTSIRQIITVFAPPAENATDAYIADVAARIGVGPDDPLDLGRVDRLAALVTAVIIHENGRCIYAPAEIAAATRAALPSQS